MPKTKAKNSERRERKGSQESRSKNGSESSDSEDDSQKGVHTEKDKEVEEDELNSTVVGNTTRDNVGDAEDLFMKTKHAMLSNLCTSKYSAGKKSEAIALVEQMHDAFLAVLDRQKKFIEQEPIVEALARIENRLADKVEEPKLPTYAEKARINAGKVRINRGRPMNTSNNRVILIYPSRENTDINSSEETLSKLKSRRPEDIGIRPEKLLPISGNGVKIIAAESTINEEELGKLGLIAKKLDKLNPRLAVIGVPNSVMDKEIEEEIGLREGSPGEVKARYKYGKRNGKDKVWVIETNAETRQVRRFKIMKPRASTVLHTKGKYSHMSRTQIMVDSNINLKIGQANLQKSRTSTMEIRHVAESSNLDVLLLQEPYSYKDKRSQWEIPGMRLARSESNLIETVSIKRNNREVIINSIYCPPDGDFNESIESLEDIMQYAGTTLEAELANSQARSPDEIDKLIDRARSPDEIHKLIDRITIGINKISNQVAGKIRPKRKYSPWWSEELTDLKRIVKQERRKYQDSKRLRQSEDNINQKRANYRDALSSYKTNIKESKDDL
ncbi:hypothetical protein JTB14_015352 [Gonioctena quinquepunctata]|nr:hypothetical protein JTB14_015352 [Gonioctena quinquepunctata]